MSNFFRVPRHLRIITGVACLLLGSALTSAEAHDGGATENVGPSSSSSASPQASPDAGPPNNQHSQLLLDIEAYYTAPLHWDVKDWAYFGGALALVAGSHHYDTQVRTHFIKEGAQPIGGNTKDLQDAVPTIAAIGGTWLYANFIDSTDGHREAWAMVEAAGLSVTSAYALKFAGGRERPDQTDDPNKWRASGSSFPSVHATFAFAVGAVLAESGNDDYRWVRRFLGYGAVAGYTAFERLKHNAHWLSDDVAGAALGGATAHFVLERNKERSEARRNYSFSVVPLEGGAMLTYNLDIQ